MNGVLTKEADSNVELLKALPPGVTAKRRLRTFKVYVLINTRIIVCHPTTTEKRSNQINNFNVVSVGSHM